MNDATLSKLWTGFALLVVYLSINVWSATQGWRIELPALVKFSASGGNGITDGAAIYGILLVAPLLATLLWLTRLYAQRRTDAPSWHGRLPVLAGWEIDATTHDGRWIQRAVLAVLIVVPLVAQAHFLDKFLGGTARSIKEGMPAITGIGHLLADPMLLADAESYRYDTLSYFPFAGPWLLVALQALVVWAAWLAFRALRGRDG